MLQPGSETFGALISKHMRALEVPKRPEAVTANWPRQRPGFSIEWRALSRLIESVRALLSPQSSRRSHGIRRDKVMTKSGMILSSLAIVALIGAVAVAVEYGGFTTLFSSVATDPGVDGSQTRVGSAAPSQPSDVEPPGAIEPAPAPPAAAQLPAPPTAQLPAPTPPAPVPNDSAASAVLDQTGSAPSAQAGSRVTAADILVPDAETGARRTALTAEEKEAIARGLKELGLTTANAPASSQSEQAATADLNRRALAGGFAEEARSKQLQAQSRQ